MAIQFPRTRKEVDDRAKADVRAALPQSNPFLKNSYLGALITGVSGREYEFYLQLRNALLEMFPDTSDGAYLERWGSYVAINRNPATQASGYVNITGTPGTIIPINTLINDSAGLGYHTTLATEIETVTASVSSLTRSGSTVTVTTSVDHVFASGQTVTIAGATPSAYNGDVEITVTDTDVFTFSISGTPTSPATGTITAAADMVSTPIVSDLYGQGQNQANGTELLLTNSIAGVDSAVWVPYDGIVNGTDVEDDEAYRSRVLFRYQNPIALFNVNSIRNQAFKQPGVTRIWVDSAGAILEPLTVSSLTRTGSIATVVTTTPHYLEDGQYLTIANADPIAYNERFKVLVIDEVTAAFVVSALATPATGSIEATPSVPNGQVIIYFTRDDDASSIPTTLEVEALKTKLLEIKPANVSVEDVVVRAPVPVTVDFTFSALTPVSADMRTAVQASLTALFRDGVNVGEDLQSYSYISAIWQTVDASGAVVTDFTLSTPTTDIAIGAGELPVLGTITFV